MTEASISSVLAKHYAAPAWAFLRQVRNGTGFARRTTRTADAIAMSLWPSRGLHLHGFEIKVSRSDLKRELAEPAKAEDIARFCHFWWIVAPAGMATPEEIPTNWGLLEIDKEAVKVVKAAVYREAQSPDFVMLAAILRNVQDSLGEMVPASELNEWRRQMTATVQASEAASYKSLESRLLEKVDERNKTLAKVEAVLGCRIHEWHVESDMKTIPLARALQKNGREMLCAVRTLINSAALLQPVIEEAAKELEAIEL